MKFYFFQVSQNKNEFQRSKYTAENLFQQVHCQRKERSFGSSKELVSIFHKLSLSTLFLSNKGWSSTDLQNKSVIIKGEKDQ